MSKSVPTPEIVLENVSIPKGLPLPMQRKMDRATGDSLPLRVNLQAFENSGSDSSLFQAGSAMHSAPTDVGSTSGDDVIITISSDSISQLQEIPGVRVDSVIPLPSRDPDTHESMVTAFVPWKNISTIQSLNARFSRVQKIKPNLKDSMKDITGGTSFDVTRGNETLQRFSEETGEGVIVGVIDYGADIKHPHFKDKNGKTRLLAIWDQRGPKRSDRVSYGTFYSKDDINKALSHPNPYHALGYRPGIPGETGSHGTHVMDIAAGSGGDVTLGGNGLSRHSRGVAPKADLIFVHSGSEFPGEEEKVLGHDFGDSKRLIDALKFIFDMAGETPCVVNISLGTNGGAHDGTSPVERAIDALVRGKPNRAVTISASNTFEDGIHQSGTIQHPGEEGAQTLSWNVPSSNDQSDNELEIWYSKDDEFSFEIQTPEGLWSPPIPLGTNYTKITYQGEVIAHVTHNKNDPDNGENSIHVLQDVSSPDGRGTWGIKLTGVRISNGSYHAWIERDDYGYDRGFIPSSFAHADPYYTLGSFSTGRYAIVVASHAAETERSSSFSSAGPTRDGRFQPFVSAPGDRVEAASSATRGRTTIMGGTSMASPTVAGLVALMFAKAKKMGKDMSINDTMIALKDTARPVRSQSGWDQKFGYGRVSFNALLHPFFHAAGASFKVSPRNARITDNKETVVPVTIDNVSETKRLVAKVDISHTYRSDLVVKLFDPHGREALLHNREGESKDDLKVAYDSSKTPELSKFIFQNPQGRWRFSIFDHEHLDGGKVNSVELIFN